MFNVTFLMEVNSTYEQYLNKLFFFSFLLQNKVIKYCKRNLGKLKSDKEYINALKQYGEISEKLSLLKNKQKLLSDDKKLINNLNLELKDIKAILNDKIFSYDLSKASIYSYGSKGRIKYKRYISSQMANDICDRVLYSLDKVLYSNGEFIHFKK